MGVSLPHLKTLFHLLQCCMTHDGRESVSIIACCIVVATHCIAIVVLLSFVTDWVVTSYNKMLPAACNERANVTNFGKLATWQTTGTRVNTVAYQLLCVIQQAHVFKKSYVWWTTEGLLDRFDVNVHASLPCIMHSTCVLVQC